MVMIAMLFGAVALSLTLHGIEQADRLECGLESIKLETSNELAMAGLMTDRCFSFACSEEEMESVLEDAERTSLLVMNDCVLLGLDLGVWPWDIRSICTSYWQDTIGKHAPFLDMPTDLIELIE